MAPSAAEDGGGVGAARTISRTSASVAVASARRRNKEGPSQGTPQLSAFAGEDLCVRPRSGGRPYGYFFAAILAVANSLMMAASVSGWSFITQ